MSNTTTNNTVKFNYTKLEANELNLENLRRLHHVCYDGPRYVAPDEYMYATRDAITRAFRALRKQGFIARQNFSCCGGCGVSEIAAKTGDTKPFVFYHRQDMQRFKESGRVYLAWGNEIENGQQIVAALRREGLTVLWDGDQTTRIQVTGLEVAGGTDDRHPAWDQVRLAMIRNAAEQCARERNTAPTLHTEWATAQVTDIVVWMGLTTLRGIARDFQQPEHNIDWYKFADAFTEGPELLRVNDGKALVARWEMLARDGDVQGWRAGQLKDRGFDIPLKSNVQPATSGDVEQDWTFSYLAS